MKFELRKTVKLTGALLLAVMVGGAAIPAAADRDDHRREYRGDWHGHHRHDRDDWRFRRHYRPPVVYRHYWYEPYYVETYPAPRVYEYYAPRPYYPSGNLNFNLNVPLF
jgi:hypothetical protein